MNLLFIGDVFGKPGRRAVQEVVPRLRRERALDLVIANGENVSHGRGITQKTAEVLFEAGVDVITTGNHAFDIQDAFSYFNREKRLLRPANYSEKVPGRGFLLQDVMGGVQVAVINLIGRVHMEPAECPFSKADHLIQELKGKADIILVD